MDILFGIGYFKYGTFHWVVQFYFLISYITSLYKIQLYRFQIYIYNNR